MLFKATEQDREQILKYCSEEPSINLFIIGDIELYGFDADFQDVWIQKEKNNVNGIILRYHDNFILYSKTSLSFEEILKLMGNYKVNIISGKGSVLSNLYPLIKDQFNKREMNFAELNNTDKLLKKTEGVITAKSADAINIAKAYDYIDEFKHLYAGGYEGRLTQIRSRIENGEGKHMFIIENGHIISHGNTAAETSICAMIGGVMTLPESRRKGNAKIIVSALCNDLKNRGKYACLFYGTDEAQQLFSSLGFSDIDKWIVLGRK